jgi:putative FmdB family regulatory protein
MPIYSYVCGRCKKYYEYLHVSSDDKKSECPYCGSQDGKKQVSTKVSGVVNGASAKNRYGLKGGGSR